MTIDSFYFARYQNNEKYMKLTIFVSFFICFIIVLLFKNLASAYPKSKVPSTITTNTGSLVSPPSNPSPSQLQLPTPTQPSQPVFRRVNNNVDSSSSTTSSSLSHRSNKKKSILCRFYQKKECQFGDKCRYSHDIMNHSNSNMEENDKFKDKEEHSTLSNGTSRSSIIEN